MKTYYQAVTRDQNTWDAKTGISPIIWDCGHKHRSPEAAYKCLSKHGAACYCYHAVIEGSDGSEFYRNDFYNLG